ncbi:MAG: ERF family protein [Candidatus Omnitrophota bacterium]|nr:ERF family protein [Candidatus Omnitrophota bacterium]
MQTSEQIDALVTALAAARPHYTEIPKNRTVTVRSDKGSYEFSYGTLDKILEATCPALAKEGIVPVFGTEYGPGGELWIVARLYHTSGQWIETSLNVGRAERTQDIGSRMTYGKRYSIQALLAVQADDDVDAEPDATTAVKSRGSKAAPAVSRNGQEGTQTPLGQPISSPPSTERSQEPAQDRPTVLGLIMDALKALMPATASVAGWRKLQGDLQHECFGTRSWTDVQTKVKPGVLAEGLVTLQAKVAALQPPAPTSPAPDEDDVPDSPVPASAPAPAAGGEVEASWEALHERARAVGLPEPEYAYQREHSRIDVVEAWVAKKEQTQPQQALEV